MDNLSKHQLQTDLLGVFESYDLSVAVGITAMGIAIRSQDERVDARNLGSIRALVDE